MVNVKFVVPEVSEIPALSHANMTRPMASIIVTPISRDLLIFKEMLVRPIRLNYTRYWVAMWPCRKSSSLCVSILHDSEIDVPFATGSVVILHDLDEIDETINEAINNIVTELCIINNNTYRCGNVKSVIIEMLRVLMALIRHGFIDSSSPLIEEMRKEKEQQVEVEG